MRVKFVHDLEFYLKLGIVRGALVVPSFRDGVIQFRIWAGHEPFPVRVQDTVNYKKMSIII